MDKTIRKSVTLKESNANKLEELVARGNYNNFSQALDDAVESKVQEYTLDGYNLGDLPEDVTLKNVVKKIIKGVKK